MRKLILVLALLAGGVLPQQAQAKSEFLDVLTATYKAHEAAISERSCAYCHVSDSDYHLNPYGKMIAQELVASNVKVLNADILKKIEPEDADQDGTPNGEEITAGTYPGDPKSGAKPGVTPPPPTTKTETAAPKPLVPKNGFHPAIVHFPIALFIAGLLLDFVGLLKKQPNLLLAGWYNLVLGAVTSLASIASGVLAMTLKGLPYKGLIFQHLLLACISAAIMWILVAMRVHRHEKMNVPLRVVYYVLAAAALLLISWSGHLGGVFVYGE